MATCTTHCRRILEQMEKGISLFRSLQVRQTSKNRIQNFAVGDIVTLREDYHQYQWPMTRILVIEVETSNNQTSSTDGK